MTQVRWPVLNAACDRTSIFRGDSCKDYRRISMVIHDTGSDLALRIRNAADGTRSGTNLGKI